MILKCLERDPADRFTSAEELADELGRWTRGENLQTKSASAVFAVRRTLRRHRRLVLSVACAFVLCISALALAIVRRPADPENPLASMQKELLANGRTQVIPEKGPARWFASVLGKPVDVSISAEGHWALSSWDLGLIDIWREMPKSKFKVRAEISHLTGDQFGYVGLYVARVEKKGQNPIHFLCDISFNDVFVDRPPIPLPIVNADNPAQLEYRVVADVGKPNCFDMPLALPAPAIQFQPKGIGQHREWRVVEIAITDGQVIGSFAGKTMEAVDRLDADVHFQRHVANRLQKQPGPYALLRDLANVQLTPSGSLGFVVYRSSMAVKNVTISRLTD